MGTNSFLNPLSLLFNLHFTHLLLLVLLLYWFMIAVVSIVDIFQICGMRDYRWLIIIHKYNVLVSIMYIYSVISCFVNRR